VDAVVLFPDMQVDRRQSRIGFLLAVVVHVRDRENRLHVVSFRRFAIHVNEIDVPRVQAVDSTHKRIMLGPARRRKLLLLLSWLLLMPLSAVVRDFWAGPVIASLRREFMLIEDTHA
jgi:hypothetical protein